MIDSYCRPLYQQCCVDPVMPLIVKTRIKAEHVTAFALIFGLIASACITLHAPLYALFFLMLSGYLDTLDGSLARARNLPSPAGAIQDIVGDRAVEFAVIFGLYLSAPDTHATMCLLMLGSILLCITSFLVVGIFAENHTEKSFFYSPGLIERTEAFLFFSFMILFPPYFVILSFIFTTLVALTTLFRISSAIRFLNR